MHTDEVETDVAVVRRLLAAQFPQWADLPIEPVASAGTDNAINRLGDGMAVRLPRRPRATEPLEKEQRWLPALSQEEALAAARTPPSDATSYHAAYDRGPIIGATDWHRAPPDGAINNPDDILGIADQFGHDCT